ncbi:hypothetical protein ERO13_D08G222350v2 [Gossypium hirsutum]|uniref:Uncharacterized protein n=1 Tax=Gossypium tomentosum TaxID=34277 RepID=A0A5D2IZL5_GOSTO|nr:hypothetical protein ERO13_D08G222350v2 [Gossypium hirsutum]TYH47764.1 hypothetical protein ES332_D10G020700v1 [Gossypium tomentosum]
MKEKPHRRRGHGQLRWPWPTVVWRRGRAFGGVADEETTRGMRR